MTEPLTPPPALQLEVHPKTVLVEGKPFGAVFNIDGPNFITVHSFSLDPKGRDTKTLLPAKDYRMVDTGLRIVHPQSSPSPMPTAQTSAIIHNLRLEAFKVHWDLDGSLFVGIQSFRHDSVNISHGTEIALIHFLPTYIVSVKLVEEKKKT